MNIRLTFIFLLMSLSSTLGGRARNHLKETKKEFILKHHSRGRFAGGHGGHHGDGEVDMEEVRWTWRRSRWTWSRKSTHCS
ncbi:hypothetical protein CEXT_572141 [Caerostris extrusa]|uniref:Uncharacterized protein n=1 Tax=Caerostris extrusa TaxID=172846 RepID=A0AAV4Q6Q1_CAEEX|nr:hypothetical protein CEXT_572141 [Caerostris extrusa]